MTGFVKAYFHMQTTDRSPCPMRFCDPDDIPVTAALARGYSVCDRWHACLPDDTFPNRLMAWSGYTRIDSTSVIQPPLHLIPNQFTIFDWLSKKGKKFSLYVDADPIANLGYSHKPLVDGVPMEIRHRERTKTRSEKLQVDWASSEPAPDVIYCEPFYKAISPQQSACTETAITLRCQLPMVRVS